MESDHVNLGVALFPKFGVEGQKVSLPQDMFHLIGHMLKTIQIPGGGIVAGLECAKPCTVSESIIPFTNMGTAY